MLLDGWVTATDLLILNKHSLAAAWRTQGPLTLTDLKSAKVLKRAKMMIP